MVRSSEGKGRSARVLLHVLVLALIGVFIATIPSSAQALMRWNGVPADATETSGDLFLFLAGYSGYTEVQSTQALDLPLFFFSDIIDETFDADFYFWLQKDGMPVRYFSFDPASPGWTDVASFEDLNGKGFFLVLPRYLNVTLAQVLSPADYPGDLFEVVLCLDGARTGTIVPSSPELSCGIARVQVVEPLCATNGLLFTPSSIPPMTIPAGQEKGATISVTDRCGNPVALVSEGASNAQWEVTSTADWLTIDSLDNSRVSLRIAQNGGEAASDAVGFIDFVSLGSQTMERYQITRKAEGGTDPVPSGEVKLTPASLSITSSAKRNPDPATQNILVTDTAGNSLAFTSVSVSSTDPGWIWSQQQSGVGQFTLQFETYAKTSGTRTATVVVTTAAGAQSMTVTHSVKEVCIVNCGQTQSNTCPSGTFYSDRTTANPMYLQADAGGYSAASAASIMQCSSGASSSSTYSASVDQAWLEVSPSQSSWGASTSGSGVLFVRANGAGLTAGQQLNGTVRVTSGSRSLSIPVRLTVSGCANGNVFVNPNTFDVTLQDDVTAPKSTVVTVSDCGGALADFAATVSYTTAAKGWLTATPQANAAGRLLLEVAAPKTAGLTAGTYTADVTVTSGTLNKAVLRVTYKVLPPGTSPVQPGGEVTVTLGTTYVTTVSAGSCSNSAPCTSFGTGTIYKVYVDAGTRRIRFASGTKDFTYDVDMIVMNGAVAPISIHPYHPDQTLFPGVLSLYDPSADSWNAEAVSGGNRYYWRIQRGGVDGGSTESIVINSPPPGWYYVRFMNVSNNDAKLQLNVTH